MGPLLVLAGLKVKGAHIPSNYGSKGLELLGVAMYSKSLIYKVP